ncbi:MULTISPECIES: transketolase [unclassified Streptomyces]|uniref:transketolase n=1 Tax=unclassified Streptomyces TaxID=2593676 RepID=UPI0008DDB948|nr:MULTISPECIES: transketolase [unclassified Streptomyces]OII64896.1 transketolase [Streptomyces sp. CC77]
MPYEELAELGQQLRADAVRAADAAGSGHPTSAMSAADLAAVLLARHLRYDFDRPDHPGNDRLVLSKGHASPLLYAMYHAAGAVDEEELLGYRTLGSRLEGHPTPRLPWVDVATGSLGQGLPVAVGMAIAGQRLDRIPYQVYVLSGDSEMAEGSVWEAVEHAADSHLDNLTLIVDVNRLGQRGPTRHGHDLDAYARRLHAFGWHVAEIDGHDLQAVDAALAESRSTTRQPTAILARTRKGRGVAAVEDREGKHGKPLPDVEDALAELGGVRRARVAVQRPPEPSEPVTADERRDPDLPRYDPGDSVATRNAYGEALTAVGSARPRVVALDAEVSDSTRAEFFAKAHPERFVECYIAEQQLVAAAVGLAARGYIPYASTFAAFLTRAHDFLRMAAVSRAGINVCGSHAGVSIGPDGPSQMGLEDLAMMRSVHGSTVLYPCDANQTARLTAALADLDGVRYLRTTRGATPVLYGPDEEFPVGGSKVLRRHDHDQVTVVAAGITVHEALKAADRLEAEDGIRARVIDLYSVKPVDAATLNDAAGQTGCVLTVEDHHPEGGIGDAVAEVFADGRQAPRTARLAVRSMPASATPEEQLHAAGIDADAIASAVRLLVERVVAH